jgi:uncharacterized protein (DUF58 family)
MSRSLFGVVERVRTPAEPGPGPLSLASLRALDLAIARRISATVAGDFRSSSSGPGTELHQVRPYQPGDDVRRIDWNVTARTGELHVRVELAERVLVTWIVLDLSASMRFGTADRRKTDVAEGVSLAVSHVATRHGNRLGAVVYGGSTPHLSPPHAGHRGLLLTLDAMNNGPAGMGTLDDGLELLQGVALQRSLVVIVSDFRGPGGWEKRLLQIAARHDVLAIEVRDRREQELTDIGELRIEDPETGRQIVLDTSDAGLRERFATAAEADRTEVAGRFASAGVPHLVVTTEGDWLRHLSVFLSQSRRS